LPGWSIALDKFSIPRFGPSESKIGRSIRAIEIAGEPTNSVDRARQRDAAAARALKLEMVMGYGGACVCCGESEPTFLTLDHTRGGGLAERKRLGSAGIYKRLKAEGWPRDGYQLLCMNCNLATKYGRTCPHQVQEEVVPGGIKYVLGPE
jgi:hypothetical protein